MYAGLASLSEGCPPVGGRLHTCYSPVRQSPAVSASTPPAALRLACVKPAASVHPEPGSNSPLLVSCIRFLELFFLRPGFLLNCRNVLTGLVYLSLYSSNNFSLLCLVAKFQSSLACRGVVVTAETRMQNYSKNTRRASFPLRFFQNGRFFLFILLGIMRINKC